MKVNSKKLIQLNKETYDVIAPFFAATRKYIWDDIKPLKKYARPGDSILDLGCGAGRLYHLFSDLQGIKYFGLDQSAGQLKIARAEFPNNQYVVGEMTTLPFDDEQFDVVYCIAALHHLPDAEERLRSLEETSRVLKPGGYAVYTNWNLYSTGAQKTVKKGKWQQEEGEFHVPWMNPKGEVIGIRYYHGFTLVELEQLYTQAGLKLEEQYYAYKGTKSSIEKATNIVSIVRKSQI